MSNDFLTGFQSIFGTTESGIDEFSDNENDVSQPPKPAEKPVKKESEDPFLEGWKSRVSGPMAEDLMRNDFGLVNMRDSGLGLGMRVAEPTDRFGPQTEAGEDAVDLTYKFAQGTVMGSRMVVDAFGADSELSKSLRGIEKDFDDLMSAGAREDKEAIARIMERAKGEGNLDQLKSAWEAFTVAPVGTIINALGTSAPIIIGSVAATLLGGPVAGVGVAAGLGMTQGSGIVKGAIYEAVKQELLKAGKSEQFAEERAVRAQEWGGQNTDLILGGGALGALATMTGLETAAVNAILRKVAPTLAKSSATKAGVTIGAETVTEAAQGGQEAYSRNVAVRDEGQALGIQSMAETGAMDGVVASAAMEGMAGAGASTPVAAFDAMTAPAEVKPPPVTTSSVNYGPVEIKIPQGGGTVTLDVKEEINEDDFIEMVLARDEEQSPEPETEVDRANQTIAEARQKQVEMADEPDELGLVSRLRKLAKNPKFTNSLPKKGKASRYFQAIEKMVEKGEVNADEWRLSPAYTELGNFPDEEFTKDDVLYYLSTPFQFVEEEQFGLANTLVAFGRSINEQVEIVKELDQQGGEQVSEFQRLPLNQTSKELMQREPEYYQNRIQQVLDAYMELLRKVDQEFTELVEDGHQFANMNEKNRFEEQITGLNNYSSTISAMISRHPTMFMVRENPNVESGKTTDMTFLTEGIIPLQMSIAQKFDDMPVKTDLGAPNWLDHTETARGVGIEPSSYREFALRLPARSDLVNLQEDLPATGVHRGLGESNTLVFARTAESELVETGERFLHVEEIQSDLLNRDIGKDVSFPQELLSDIDKDKQGEQQEKPERVVRYTHPMPLALYPANNNPIVVNESRQAPPPRDSMAPVRASDTPITEEFVIQSSTELNLLMEGIREYMDEIILPATDVEQIMEIPEFRQLEEYIPLKRKARKEIDDLKELYRRLGRDESEITEEKIAESQRKALQEDFEEGLQRIGENLRQKIAERMWDYNTADFRPNTRDVESLIKRSDFHINSYIESLQLVLEARLNIDPNNENADVVDPMIGALMERLTNNQRAPMDAKFAWDQGVEKVKNFRRIGGEPEIIANPRPKYEVPLRHNRYYEDTDESRAVPTLNIERAFELEAVFGDIHAPVLDEGGALSLLKETAGWPLIKSQPAQLQKLRETFATRLEVTLDPTPQAENTMAFERDLASINSELREKVRQAGRAVISGVNNEVLPTVLSGSLNTAKSIADNTVETFQIDTKEAYKKYREDVTELFTRWGLDPNSFSAIISYTRNHPYDRQKEPNVHGLDVYLLRLHNTAKNRLQEEQDFGDEQGWYEESDDNNQQYVPARNKLYDMMMRRLAAYAVANNYDGISLTTSDAQIRRWSGQYERLYRDLYDTRFPKQASKLLGSKPEVLPVYKKTVMTDYRRDQADREGFDFDQDMMAATGVTTDSTVIRFTPAKKEEYRKKGIPLLRNTTDQQEAGLSIDEAQQAAESVLRKMRIGDELKVTMYPSVPEGFPQARGWVTKGGDVVIVAGAHKTAQDVQETVLHEIVGHYGIRRIMSQDDIAKLMTRINIAVRRDGEFREAVMEMKSRGVSMQNPAEFAEEIFAFMAEQPMTRFQMIRAEIVAVIKEVMRKLGFNVAEITEAEVMRVVARSARSINRGDKIKSDSAFGQGRTVELDNQQVADDVARGMADPNQPELLRERDVAVIPEKSIDGINEKTGFNLDKRQEGTYLAMEDGRLTDEVLNGQLVNNTTVGLDERGLPKMRIDQIEKGDPLPTVDKKDGNLVKINMFKKSAGWNWIDEPKDVGYPTDKFIVSTTTSWKGKSSQHFYSLEVDSPIPVILANYPNEKNEPRSRPTTNGVPTFGKVVGTINVRGRLHPVYDKVVLIKKGDPIPEGMSENPASIDDKGEVAFFSRRREGGRAGYFDMTEANVDANIRNAEREAYYGANQTEGYFVRMPIDDFLTLTTTDEYGRDQILKEGPVASNIGKPEPMKGRFDPEEVDRDEINATPLLELSDRTDESGNPIVKVTGHEGRHRAALAAQEGATTMPVLVKYRDKLVYDFEQNAARGGEQDFADLTASREVVGQFDPTRRVTLPQGVEATYPARERAYDVMTSRAEQAEMSDLDMPVAFRLEGGNDSMPEMAINVRVDSEAGLDYAELIISGDKTYETRDSDSLRPYVGRRVGIARTGAGKAQAIGSVEIGEPLVVSEEEFRSLQDQHMVPEGSAFDIKAGGQKFLYPVSNPERFDQPMDVGAGIVSRRIVADASTPSRYDVDTLINEEVPEGVNNKADFVEFIDGLQERPRDLEADRDAIAEDLARETEVALNKSGNAAEWYRETIAGAMAVAAKVFPEIGTDPDAKAAFQFALAITSNGAGVDENTINAVSQYQSFRRTGKFPEKGWGKETEAMVNSFRVFNRLIDTYGLTELNRLMNMEWTAGDLKELGFNVSGELADAPMYFSAIFGPKIGQGFYQNLGGNWTPLTMDRWFMRTIGRVTGRLSMYDNQKHVGYVEAARKATEESGSGIELAISRYNKNATEKVTIDDFMNDFDVATDVLMAGYRAWSQSSFDKSMDLPVMRTGRSLSKLFETRDAPSTGTERAQIRALMNDVQQKLADKGLDLDMASIQALLWFPEKALYLHFGVTSKKATPTDYEQEMIKVARKKGISKKEIDDGLRNKTQSSDGESDGSADRQDRGEGRSDAQLQDAVRRDQYVRRLAQELGGGNGAFRRGSRKTNTLNLPFGRQKVDGTSYKVGTGWKRTLLSKLQSAAGAPTEYVELAPSRENAQLFTDLITRAAESHGDRGKQVYIYDVEEIADAKLFITPDGLGGFAVKKDGDIVSLFATAGGPFKNVSFTALALAVQAGGVKLDAFDPVLPKLYRRMGFSTAARVAFDPNEKPDGWNTETMGEPDVHFMVFDPAGVVKDKAETVAYGKALTTQNLAKTKAKKARGQIRD